MATVLLISRQDAVKFTNINGSIDTDIFIQYIKEAQDTILQSYLGTDLLEKLQADITAGSLAGNYLTLTNTYIKPALIQWSYVCFLPNAPYKIGNNGVYKKNSDNAENISLDELNNLIDNARLKADNYTRRMIDYINDNTANFPEYSGNDSPGDVYPKGDINGIGWYL